MTLLILAALVAYGLLAFALGIAVGHANERERRRELNEIAQSAIMRGLR